MKVLVIGAGNMGSTYAEGMIGSPLLGRKELMIYDADPGRREELRKDDVYDVHDRLDASLPQADVVFIAVKPYHTEELFEEMKPHINSDQIFVSIMAGVTLDYMSDALGVDKIIRAMPNLPAQVGKGMTSFTGTDGVSRVELLTIENLLKTTGKAIHVSNERFIDASTGISGSGPAYIFYFMESMMDAARDMGFSEKTARILVSSTFEGATELFNQNNISPATWMSRVASKGGTTRAALDSLADNNVHELIHEAAFAAFKRAMEIGEESTASAD
ncbi:MAG: pyrroline-5-carboxylate reductase [Flavobacteriia bacterium]|nr:pyrroline-5-carboxylate reductase [Flavobacteriia bacterium]